MKNKIKNRKFNDFDIVGDDYDEYYFNSNKFIVLDDDNINCLVRDEPITLEYIIDYLNQEEIKLTNTFLETFIKKWKIKSFRDDGSISLYPTSIYELLQGFVTYNNMPCYLQCGSWYVFDVQYEEILHKKFQEIYNNTIKQAYAVANKFSLNSDIEGEDIYNLSFKESRNIICAHKVIMKNIEIADAIFYDNETLYLMHNKGDFDGSGARDVFGQINASSLLISRYKMSSNFGEFLNVFYNKLKGNNKIMPSFADTYDKFKDLFISKNICYIVGFLKKYSLKTRSNYAKFAVIDTNSRLKSINFEFIPMNINND